MSKKDINKENEVYFLGSKEGGDNSPKEKNRKWLVLGICLAVLAIIILLVFLLRKPTEEYYFEPVKEKVIKTVIVKTDSISQSDTIRSYIEVLEETVNDVPMFVYVPHHAEMSLAVGVQDKTDSTIVFITQAADIRGDNQDIVGDFVLAGKRLSRGVAKEGFCAVINGEITIGVADKTPLLQESIEEGGYFFRQYPLVDKGELIENNPKNKSIRRALAIRSGKVVMIESRSAESFHDFAQALIDIGVSEAIYLVGTNNAYGWYYDQQRNKTEYGTDPSEELENTTFIVWRSK
ncbi:hypothetical protein [Prevotella sp. 10(H)]|uniref:hypothetical protein n=1 Tax=Prevotella sp. 10(H) TaxID=1158294 RepID=UPI0004A7108A|nr:hypothetical protein [Prevotella sp. 10(H)]